MQETSSASKWLPMKDAPRDGRPCWLRGHGHRFLLFWKDNHWRYATQSFEDEYFDGWQPADRPAPAVSDQMSTKIAAKMSKQFRDCRILSQAISSTS